MKERYKEYMEDAISHGNLIHNEYNTELINKFAKKLCIKCNELSKLKFSVKSYFCPMRMRYVIALYTYIKDNEYVMPIYIGERDETDEEYHITPETINKITKEVMEVKHSNGDRVFSYEKF